jgi:preprotein translocase subunit SecD
MTRALLLILGLVVFVTLSCCCRSGKLESRGPTPVELRLAAGESQPGWASMKVAGTGETIYVSPDVVLSNGDIASAELTHGPAGEPWVAVHLTPEGTTKLAEFTSSHIGQTVAIIVDRKVAAVPTIRAEITDGRTLINGKFTESEAKDLARSIVPKK